MDAGLGRLPPDMRIGQSVREPTADQGYDALKEGRQVKLLR